MKYSFQSQWQLEQLPQEGIIFGTVCFLKTSIPLKESFPLHQVLQLHSLSSTTSSVSTLSLLSPLLKPLLISHNTFVLLAHFCSQHHLLLSCVEIILSLSIFKTALKLPKTNIFPVEEAL